MENYYKVLDLDNSAQLQDIKKAYKKLAKQPEKVSNKKFMKIPLLIHQEVHKNFISFSIIYHFSQLL